MDHILSIIRDAIDALPERAVVALMLAAVVALAVWTFSELSALSVRVNLTERASVVLLCRAGEVDEGRDPRACWYFMQGQEDQFMPPPGWRRAAPDEPLEQPPTVP